MEVTLPLVSKGVHSSICSISARGVQVGYRYHYPVPQPLYGVTGHFVTLRGEISSIKQKFGTLALQRTGEIMIAEILVLQTHFLTVPQPWFRKIAFRDRRIIQSSFSFSSSETPRQEWFIENYHDGCYVSDILGKALLQCVANSHSHKN